MAEKEGFEPSRPFRGLHDFQSCALDQLGDFSIAVKHSTRIHLWLLFRDSVIIIADKTIKSSLIFAFSAENAERVSTALFFILFQQVLDGFVQKAAFIDAGLFGKLIKWFYQLICQGRYEFFSIYQNRFAHNLPPLILYMHYIMPIFS